MEFYEAGVDEAGKGPLLGPVFAAAVILGDTEPLPLIRDSKKMSKKNRARAKIWIQENAKSWAIGSCSEIIIDEINIRNATFKAMHNALENLDIKPDKLVIDGNCFQEWESIPHMCIVKGDQSHMNISCASILAKEAHDDYIKQLVIDNPDLQEKYNLIKNMGYGTKHHIQGLLEHGPTIFHRHSFSPVTNVLYKLSDRSLVRIKKNATWSLI